MWAGHGGSAAGRFRNAQTAHVKAAKAAAINKPGNDFMEGAHHTRLRRAPECQPVAEYRLSGSPYHTPTFCMDFQGSAGSRGVPFCSSSIDMLSGERTKAIQPSRGGRLMVTP